MFNNDCFHNSKLQIEVRKYPMNENINRVIKRKKIYRYYANIGMSQRICEAI